jgi:hypothetical protein
MFGEKILLQSFAVDRNKAGAFGHFLEQLPRRLDGHIAVVKLAGGVASAGLHIIRAAARYVGHANQLP